MALCVLRVLGIRLAAKGWCGPGGRGCAPCGHVPASGNTTIKAWTVGGVVAGSAGKSIAVGVTLANNQLSSTVKAQVADSTVTAGRAAANGLAARTGGLRIAADRTSTYEAGAISAAVSVAAGGDSALTLSGGGADAVNVLAGSVQALLDTSTVTTQGAVTVLADNEATLSALVLAFSASVSVSGGRGAALAMGVARARNATGAAYNRDSGAFSEGSRNETLARISNASVTAQGALDVKAIHASTVTARVGAAAVAATLSPGHGASGAGAGADALNKVQEDITATIGSNDGTARTVEAGALTVQATDQATLRTDVGSAAVAAALTGSIGFTLTIGVALARNQVANHVLASIDAPLTTVKATSTLVDAHANGSIKATSVAASVSASFAGSAGIALAGAGAHATNEIGTRVESKVAAATLRVASLEVKSEFAATVNATVAAVAAAVGVGGDAGLGLAIGASLATNQIGTAADSQAGVFASIASGATVEAQAAVKVQAKLTSSITAGVGAGAFAIAGGSGGALGASGAGASVTNETAMPVRATIHAASVTSGLDSARVGGLSVLASDTSSAQAVVGAAALAAAMSGGAAITASIAASIARNTLNNTVWATAEAGAMLDSRDGALMISATQSAALSAESIAVSLSIAVGGATGIAVSGAGAGAYNTLTGQVLAVAKNATLTTMAAQHTSSASSGSMATGDRVRVDGQLYRYLGSAPLAYGGTSPALTSLNFNDAAQWARMADDVQLIAARDSTLHALVGSTAGAVAAGTTAGAVAVGASVAKNQVGATLNGVALGSTGDVFTTTGGMMTAAEVIGGSVNASGKLQIEARQKDVVDITGFSAAVAISGGAGAVSAAGNGVGVYNDLAGAVRARMWNADATVLGQLDIAALGSVQVSKAMAVGVGISAAIGIGGAISVGASIVDNAVRQAIVADVGADTAHTLTVYGDARVAANEDVSADADTAMRNQTRILGVEAEAVNVSAGLIAGAGGGIDIRNTVDNRVSSQVRGITLNSMGNVRVVAQDTARLSATAVGTTVAIGFGGAIGVSLVSNEVKSVVSATVRGVALTSDDLTVSSSVYTYIPRTLSVGVSASLVAAQGTEATAKLQGTSSALVDGSTLTLDGALVVSSRTVNEASTSADGGAAGVVAVGGMVSKIRAGFDNRSDTSVAAITGNGQQVFAKSVVVTASGKTNLEASSVAAAGGAYAAMGAQSEVSDLTVNAARLGAGVQITTGDFSLSANNDGKGDSAADAYALAMASGSGGGTANVLKARADVSVGDGASVRAKNISLSAINSLRKD
eukprot:gene31039-38363_t